MFVDYFFVKIAAVVAAVVITVALVKALELVERLVAKKTDCADASEKAGARKCA